MAEHVDEWFRAVAARHSLSSEQTSQLDAAGFIVVPGPLAAAELERLSDAYDAAVASAHPDDVSVRSSTRISDFVNRGPVFDAFYVHEPLLAACCAVIGRPFKLSTMHARTIEPGARAQDLHVDVEWESADWPLVGFIVMVDAFTAANGATRFVPGTHRTETVPAEVMNDVKSDRDGQVLACGAAGSMIVFNGSTWHGYTANESGRPRRSIQGAFIPRGGRSAMDHAARLRPETRDRLTPLAMSLLDLAVSW